MRLKSICESTDHVVVWNDAQCAIIALCFFETSVMLTCLSPLQVASPLFFDRLLYRKRMPGAICTLFVLLVEFSSFGSRVCVTQASAYSWLWA